MANTDAGRVRVFSLNCWSVAAVYGDQCGLFLDTWKTNGNLSFLRGICYLTKHRRQRYVMIGDMLCKEEHDIVLLQEVGGSPFFVSFVQFQS